MGFELEKTDIGQFLNEMIIIDTHEHFPPEKAIIDTEVDFFTLLIPYICDDMISSGMTLKDWGFINDKKISFKVRWSLFNSYLENIKHTSFFMSLKSTLKERYGFEEFTYDSVFIINKYLKANTNEGFYRKELNNLNIEKVLNILPDYRISDEFDKNIFSLIPTVNKICPTSCHDIFDLSDYTGVSIDSLQSLDDAIDIICEKYLKNGVRSLKLGNAYQRKLDFKYPDRKLAEKILNDILNGTMILNLNERQIRQHYIDFEKIAALDDYITFKMLEKASENNWSVFIHTGIHAWNFNKIDRCRANHLQYIIEMFKDVRFVLLHCGFPYIDDALLLAKYYPNVHLDLTWTHIIDRYKARELINRVIEMIPQNKICGFGGDYFYIGNVHGHLKIAKENIAYVLNERIESKEMSLKDAKKIANKWLYENPKEYF